MIITLDNRRDTYEKKCTNATRKSHTHTHTHVVLC